MSPTVSSNSFLSVPAIIVMTLTTYQNVTFVKLDVSIGTTIEGCLPMPTHTFTESNKFTESKSSRILFNGYILCVNNPCCDLYG